MESPQSVGGSHAEFFGRGDGVIDPPDSVLPGLTAGTIIANKYELLRKVGVGAMGEVWAARHRSLGEEVAIKLVRTQVTHGDGSRTDTRFLFEARACAQLSRKTRHIVSATDHGEENGLAYLVMELLNGESLEMRLARSGPLPLAKVVPLVYQIARALAVAHADGVVHRDLKPSNIFVTTDEYDRALIKILDFGIAKHRPSMRNLPVAASLRGFGMVKHATLSGVLLGTPAFMSPEQARGRPLDHRADVWALAVIAYNLLSNEVPFDAEDPQELIELVADVIPVPIRHFRPDLPHEVFELFDKAFSERIDERFQTAPSFARALERIDSRSRQHEGGFPAPMIKISLPPPRPDPLPPVQVLPARAKERERRFVPAPYPTIGEGSILIPGLLRRRSKLMPQIAAGLVLLSVLLGTVALLVVSFEREREPMRPAAAAPAPTVEPTDRDTVPPPPVLPPREPEPTPRLGPQTLFPVISPRRAAQRAALVVPDDRAASFPSLPREGPPAAPRVRRSFDRSEVF